MAAGLFAGAVLPQARADGPAPGGTWEGSFNFVEANRPENTPFKMTFTSVTADSQDAKTYRIMGTITEPRTDFGPQNQTTLTSAFTGQWDGGHITFTKVYDYDGHVVKYSGDDNGNSGIVSGLWHIGDYNGPFTLHTTAQKD